MKRIWENKIYKEGRQLNICPYTDVFSFLVREFGPNARGKRLLEIGCGVGNNLLFARWAMGFDIYGIDHSKTAIRTAKRRFRDKKLSYQKLEVADAVKLPYSDGYFDAVVDRAAIQHNDGPAIKKIIAEVHRVLGPKGVFYSSNTSKNHQLYGKGKRLGANTYLSRDVGTRHFFSPVEIRQWYGSLFDIEGWRQSRNYDLKRGNTIANGIYHLEMRKPGG